MQSSNGNRISLDEKHSIGILSHPRKLQQPKGGKMLECMLAEAPTTLQK